MYTQTLAECKYWEKRANKTKLDSKEYYMYIENRVHCTYMYLQM